MRTMDAFLDVLVCNNSFDKNTLIVAVGGGITTDMGGLTAALYKRGVKWIAVPTTLVGMTDAAIGGKVAVNHLIGGKNQIGTMHLPEAVIIDHSFSSTWNDRIRLNGRMEMLKTMLMLDDRRVMDFVSGPTTPYIDLIASMKETLTRVHPEDGSPRDMLNFGHTIGHAAEIEFEWDHGYSVGVGMVVEAIVALNKGVIYPDKFDLIHECVVRLGCQLKEVDYSNHLLDLIMGDKKNRNGKIRMSLPPQSTHQAFTDSFKTTEVEWSEIKSAIDRYNSIAVEQEQVKSGEVI